VLAIARELADIEEEQATYSAQGQLEQAKLWRAVNLFGAPAAGPAAIAGATTLVYTARRVGWSGQPG
jgi:hypothetical protein